MVNLRQALQPNKRAVAVVIAGGLLFACGEANIETTLSSDSSVAFTTEDTTPAELTPVEPPLVEPIPVNLGEIPTVFIKCYFNEDPMEAAQLGTGGTWLQFRGDRTLSGRSGLVGTTTCPEVLWSHDLAARLSLLEVEFDSSVSKSLPLPDTGELGDRFELFNRYTVGERWFDLDGDGWNHEKSTDHGVHRVGDLLPDLPGYEMISCDTGQYQIGAGSDDPLPCYLLNRSKYAWETVWISEPFSGFTNSMSIAGQPLIGDFDVDGEPEVAVLPWYDVQILDLATGTLEASGNYKINVGGESHEYDSGDPTSGRGYGFFGAYDLGNDDRSEFVILGDFEMFVSVLGWRDDKLVELWDHQITKGIYESTVIHEPGASPVADINGDGAPDIVTSIFNEHGDGQWHVVGFDGLTGTTIVDLVNRHLAALGDLDGDGIAELFVTVTEGSAVPDHGPVEILDATQALPRSVWSSNSSGFERLDIPEFPLYANSRTNWQRKSIFLYRDPQSNGLMFATRSQEQETDNVTIHFNRANGGIVSEIGSITGPLLELRGIDQSAETLRLLVGASNSQPGTSVTTDGLEATITYSGRTRDKDGHPASRESLLTGSVVGDLDGSGPFVVTQGVNETIQALKVDTESGLANIAWTTSGRGMVSDIPTIISNSNGFASVALADIYGTGEHAVLVADKRPNGFAVLRALDGSGESIWETEFDVPGDPPIFGTSGITHWTAGHFRDLDREDVLVAVRKTKPHSEQLHLLDGRTGDVLWIRESGGLYSCNVPYETGASGSHMAIFDWDGDGLDDILNTYSGLFAVYDGSDASMLLNRWTTECWRGRGPDLSGIFDQGFKKHPLPVAADFLGNGTEQILLAGIDSTIAVLETSGDPIWHSEMFSGSPKRTMQGIGDIDGDGDLDLVSVGHCNEGDSEIQVFEASTGDLRWTFDLNPVCSLWMVPTHVVTVDLDGDGRDEALFTYGNVLYAIGEGEDGSGHLAWYATFRPNSWEAMLGDLAIGDVDGTGKPQILVNTESGHLYGIG